MLRFEWDERKNRSNRTRHGVWFEEAQTAFRDPNARLFHDPEHSEEEDRFILIGLSSAARPLVVVHCYREPDSVIRIISARKATKKEYEFSRMKELKNPYKGKKQAVGINLSPEVVDYFKGLADETGLPYQKLIDLYLLDCAKKRKKLTMKWVA